MRKRPRAKKREETGKETKSNFSDIALYLLLDSYFPGNPMVTGVRGVLSVGGRIKK